MASCSWTSAHHGNVLHAHAGDDADDDDADDHAYADDHDHADDHAHLSDHAPGLPQRLLQLPPQLKKAAP